MALSPLFMVGSNGGQEGEGREGSGLGFHEAGCGGGGGGNGNETPQTLISTLVDVISLTFSTRIFVRRRCVRG
jgi:hypothetical protein